MINTSIVAPLVDRETRNADTALMLSMAPLWRNPQYVVGNLQIDEQLRAQIAAVCENPQQAERTRQTAQAAIVLAGNQLAAIQNNVAARPGGSDDEQMLLSTLLKVAVTAIEATETTTDGSRALLQVQLPADSASQAIATVAPTLLAARRAAYQAQSLNNMKQIMLAMHNYHDVYKVLPAAINHKNPGDPGHSWRVALLPYLEQQDLYRQYRFDEPWDSEHNRRLIERMPEVFRNPNQPADTKFTNYFVFVGGGAIFDPGKAPSFRDIRDGTSNTIAIVEAERHIPWTKPEDIPFSPNQPLPKLGLGDGRVSIGLADGAVRTVPLNIPEAVFKNLIMRSDGQLIEWDF